MFCRMALRLSGLQLIDACRPDKRSRRHPALFGGYLIPSALIRSRTCCARAADAG
ncbi:TPA: hypothetical protein G9X05_003921 [Salmonella enterica subsp. enterica serovar Java]|uniref:Uncharacterized protein n=4 Tax=Salmonella enterica TaxID=28901 RepID=A0A739NP05_SALEB|nr:hypothetical protein [Salmonella enterica subsp. enterica serovar Oslo]EDQ5485352.1 hypothetical protein [Salmonella enterica]EDQ9651014.1 hypothetical protein [Salmonella enterica subsp. enterica serovar Java]EDR2103651.1 hypothetical protein [Salmonella enterica subsp. enterica]EEH8148294.1 hypothetical protein [Salmonella enterica subsp. enterica serovar Virchow]